MVLVVLAALTLQQTVDSAYTAKIRELTTEPRFNTELTDHLPADPTVPTPFKVLGYVPGTVGRLSYLADITRYFRALDAASPRVKVFDLGTSDEGRPMIVAAIADSATIERLEQYRDITAALADPRRLSPDSAQRLIGAGKAIYYASGSIHSPETGSPEMLMELAYRLAVEDTPFIRQICDSIITLITPVTEVDGRDRQVDVYDTGRPGDHGADQARPAGGVDARLLRRLDSELHVLGREWPQFDWPLLRDLYLTWRRLPHREASRAADLGRVVPAEPPDQTACAGASATTSIISSRRC